MFNETIPRALTFETMADDDPALFGIDTGRLYDIAGLLDAEGHASCARDVRTVADLLQDIHDRLRRTLQ